MTLKAMLLGIFSLSSPATVWICSVKVALDKCEGVSPGVKALLLRRPEGSAPESIPNVMKGNAIDFFMLVECRSFNEAMEILTEKD